MRRALAALFVLAGCASSPAAPAASAKPAETDTAALVRDRGGVHTSDPRWKDRLQAIEVVSASAKAQILAETGLAFERGREPVIEFDPGALPQGEVTVRFVDGVRRATIRIPPANLLNGEFRAADDLPPLVAEGAILVAAGESEPPAWVRTGVPLVATGQFDRRLHERALGGAEILSGESALFGSPSNDPLAAAARASALARIARTEHPFARFLQLVVDGKSEDAALAEMGVQRREFLDAAAETERSRAARSIADDRLLRPLAAARAALADRKTDRADAALAEFADALADPSGDPWIAADARLCLAEIAIVRGDTKGARADYEAAGTSRIVRHRAARIIETVVAAPAARPALLRALVADYPFAAELEPIAALVGVPSQVVSTHPSIVADVLSADASRRRTAAVHLGESISADAAIPLRFLAADPDAGVRRAALAGLALSLGRAADADVEAATRDADAGVRGTALELLVVSDRKRALKCAEAMRSDPDAGIRARATELLGAK